MKIHVLTLFPDFFGPFTEHSMMKRAVEKKAVEIRAHNLRDFTHDRHKTCDDRPFGGGPGMLMKPEPVFEAMKQRFPRWKKSKTSRFVYLTPQGERFTQRKAEELAKCKEIIFLCGHYEGVDQRIIDRFATDEISIGDYVVTGGEIPAMIVIDAVVRLLKGVLGKEESKSFESFTRDLIEYPQYTRPAEYQGLKVPDVLLSGNHKEIERWREAQAYQRTLERRPDLLKKVKRSK